MSDVDTPRGHRRPRTVLVDVDDAALSRELSRSFTPHRVHEEQVATPSDAVVAVASRGADLVVVAPGPAEDLDEDQQHRLVGLRSGWWVSAAQVVGARIVLVVGTRAFEDQDDPDQHRPDEFTRPRPSSPSGRAWRAAEVAVRAAGGTIVRAGDDVDPSEVAALVRWAANHDVGTWHLSGASGSLDDRHTRLVRAGP